MDFAKFPFDQQNCTVEMILDEVLHGNVTIVTGAVMFTSQLVHQKFTPSEFSYDYKVQIICNWCFKLSNTDKAVTLISGGQVKEN